MSSSNLLLSSDNGSSSSTSPEPKNKGPEALPYEEGANNQNFDENTPNQNPNIAKTTFSNTDQTILGYYDYFFPATASDADGNPINYQPATHQEKNEAWLQAGIDEPTRELLKMAFKDGLKVGLNQETLAEISNFTNKIDTIEPTLNATLNTADDKISNLINAADDKIKNHLDRAEEIAGNCTDRAEDLQRKSYHNFGIVAASVVFGTLGSMIFYKHHSEIKKFKSKSTLWTATGFTMMCTSVGLLYCGLKGSTPAAQQ